MVDSGFIYDTTISGGRTGIFVHAQPGAIFSNLKYECLDRVNEALQFDGVDDYLVTSDVVTLEMKYRLTNNLLCKHWSYFGFGLQITQIYCIVMLEECMSWVRVHVLLSHGHTSGSSDENA